MLKENLLSIYADSFKDHWSLPALTDYITKETLTYGDFAKSIAYYHLLFEQLGIKPGDKIALMGKNTTTWVTVFMSTITYGAVIVPVLQEFNPRDAQHIINHSDADLLFVSNNLWETFEFEKIRGVRDKIMLVINGIFFCYIATLCDNCLLASFMSVNNFLIKSSSEYI